ncbi:hypothetical protein [Geitlerinema sp. P-1104]|uniref:hypothetical protein n=1 Tax=Geitlerinema sp. P-1104 TaxID=2546230 RepID=UPI0014769149|nr:hypothetical protein [Geitlerinema sp. P-1104]
MSSSSRPNSDFNDTMQSPLHPPNPDPKESVGDHPPKAGADALLRPKPPVPPPPEDKPASPAAEEASAPPESQPPQRPVPIPPPSEPRQYRAIGVVRGRYVPSEEQLTQGQLETGEDMTVEAVLLGRVMSLVKNHIDLEQDHLWVVYPRTGQRDGNLHLQIVGVWEPEKLSQEESESELPPLSSEEVHEGYFSVRGEVVFYSEEEQRVIVKIRQGPRKAGQPPKFFKVALKGTATGRVLRHFWSFEVERQGQDLVILTGENMGVMPPKRQSRTKSPQNRRPGRRKSGPESRGSRPTPRPKKVKDSQTPTSE